MKGVWCSICQSRGCPGLVLILLYVTLLAPLQVAEVVLLMMQEVSRVAISYLEHASFRGPNGGDSTEDQVLTAQVLLELMHQVLHLRLG